MQFLSLASEVRTVLWDWALIPVGSAATPGGQWQNCIHLKDTILCQRIELVGGKKPSSQPQQYKDKGTGGRILGWNKECCSVTKSWLTLCNLMDCSTQGFSVLHYLPEFAQIHVHWVGDVIQPSHPLSSPSPPAFNLSQHQGLFQWVNSSY